MLFKSLLSISFFIGCSTWAQVVSLENPSFLPSHLNLPVIKITTENNSPVISKDDYLKATMDIETHQGVETHTLQIKGRGNSTWQMPKKPYRLKLDNKAALLSMSADKDWALLANYADKTLLRTQLAFDLSQKLNMAWTPQSAHVEVFVNGDYVGVFQLTETIKVAPHRVNIVEVKSKDTLPPEEGGYLLEIDQRKDADFCFETTLKALPLCLKSPDPGNAEQQKYIINVINEFESALTSSEFTTTNSYTQHIDVKSFIDFYLVSEITKNVDAKSFSSIYMFKNKGGKITMGPLWDFDLSFGNADYNTAQDPTGFWVKLGPWYSRLFEDPAFEAQVKKRYWEIRYIMLAELENEITNSVLVLNQAQENNFLRWTILDQYVWPNPVVTGSYVGEIDNLKQWIKTRLLWLDKEWAMSN